jgi:hypothetical protein
MDPECPVETVCSVYAVGPASPATRASASPARSVPRPYQRPARSVAAAANATTRTTQRSHGSHEVLRESRTNDQAPVPSVTPARSPSAQALSRRAQTRSAPIPTSAAIAGASATV